MGGGNLLNSFSVSSVKYSQLAFLKLIYVLLALVIGFMSVSSDIIIGRWSEPKLVSVDHEA